MSRPAGLPIHGLMAFEPHYRLIPRIIRQIKAIERTAGMIEAVRGYQAIIRSLQIGDK